MTSIKKKPAALVSLNCENDIKNFIEQTINAAADMDDPAFKRVSKMSGQLLKLLGDTNSRARAILRARAQGVDTNGLPSIFKRAA